MQLPLTYYSLGVTISFCKFWFENDTLIRQGFPQRRVGSNPGENYELHQDLYFWSVIKVHY